MNWHSVGLGLGSVDNSLLLDGHGGSGNSTGGAGGGGNDGLSSVEGSEAGCSLLSLGSGVVTEAVLSDTSLGITESSVVALLG